MLWAKTAETSEVFKLLPEAVVESIEFWARRSLAEIETMPVGLAAGLPGWCFWMFLFLLFGANSVVGFSARWP